MTVMHGFHIQIIGRSDDCHLIPSYYILFNRKIKKMIAFYLQVFIVESIILAV